MEKRRKICSKQGGDCLGQPRSRKGPYTHLWMRVQVRGFETGRFGFIVPMPVCVDRELKFFRVIDPDQHNYYFKELPKQIVPIAEACVRRDAIAGLTDEQN